MPDNTLPYFSSRPLVFIKQEKIVNTPGRAAGSVTHEYVHANDNERKDQVNKSPSFYAHGEFRAYFAGATILKRLDPDYYQRSFSRHVDEYRKKRNLDLFLDPDQPVPDDVIAHLRKIGVIP